MQEGEGNVAVANPGLAYGGAYGAADGGAVGASALSPSTGSCAGVAGTTQPGTGLQPVLSQPGKDANTMQDGDSDDKQHGLALPFVPVALVFKDVHYYVKHREGSGELQLLKASVLQPFHCAPCAWNYIMDLSISVSMCIFACCNPVFNFVTYVCNFLMCSVLLHSLFLASRYDFATN